MNVGHVLREMAILFCYCLVPFVLRSSKNEKSTKLFFLIYRPNLNGFSLTIYDILKVFPSPLKSAIVTKNQLTFVKVMK